MSGGFIHDAVATPIGRYGGALTAMRADDLAAQALALLRDLDLPDDAPHVDPNGSAIAKGHLLGTSDARLVTTATYQQHRQGARYAFCAICIGVGQGIAIILERV